MKNILITGATSGIGKELVKLFANDCKVFAAYRNKNLIDNIENVEFKVAKVEDVINDYIKKDVNTIVVDPPRKGLDQNVVKALLDSNIKRIVYVSCNPTSFARDLNLLKEKFNLIKLSVVDMFCQTTGAECVSLLELK